MRAARDTALLIVWCGHNNRQGESTSCFSCVQSAVKSAVNSHTLHHLPRALAITQHTTRSSPG
eukprot:2031672-Prymnesium_polylepis.1